MPEIPPIARKRDAAVAMRIGDADDRSSVSSMITVGKKLYIVKEAGIYEVALADQIDPDRTNIGAPNTQQRVLDLGANSPLVGRILLTAKELFNKSYLPNGFDDTEALRLSLDMLKDLAAMAELTAVLVEDQQRAIAKFEDRRRQDGSVLLPAVGNVSTRCRDYIQKADHSLRKSLSIARLFYGGDVGRRWFEGFAELVSTRHGRDDVFARFLVDVLPTLKLIRNARNCVEHARDNQRLIVQDFSMRPDGAIVPPGIEIVHAETPQPTISVVSFMEQVNDFIVEVQELMMAFMCDKHVQPFGGFLFEVVELPDEIRSDRHVRYSYGLYDADGKVIRAS